MIADVSDVVSASLVGRSIAKLRIGLARRFDLSSMLDWVIPPTLTAVIVVAFAWIVFAAK